MMTSIMQPVSDDKVKQETGEKSTATEVADATESR